MTAKTAVATAHPFTDGPIVRNLGRLAAPGLLGGLMQSILYVADGWFVGTLGALPLAGVALVFPLFALSVMLSAGALGGAVVGATARTLGARDFGGAASMVRTAFVLAILGGAVSAAVAGIFGPAFFRLLGGEGVVLEVAVDYASVLFPGIVVVWLFNMLASLLRGSGDMKRPALGLGVTAVFHVLAAAILVRGAGPVPAFGVAGAAAAILIGYGAGGLYLAAHLFRFSRPHWIAAQGRIAWSQVAVVGRRGLLAGIQSVLTIAMALVVTALMARVDPGALAGYGIGVRLELLIIPVIFAFGSACIAMAGVCVGAGDRARALRITWAGSALATVSVGAVGIFLAFFPQLWSGLFTADPEVAAMTALYLRFVGPAYMFFALGLCLYFSSQALNTLFWPVTGAAIRLAVLIAGGFIVLEEGATDARAVFILVSGAMTVYGLFNALTLLFGPWRR